MNKIGIVAFSFGAPSTISANTQITRIAEDQARLHNAPIYTQKDIKIHDSGIVVYQTDEEPGCPPPTLRIARGAVKWAKELSINELEIICAEPHLWRVKRDLEEAIRESGEKIIISVCPQIVLRDYHEDSWFDLSSTQKRTRSRRAWEKRENILKLLPFSIYTKIAS
ncbi:MAG: hypothetical protein A2494_03670 [Candidatus Lloydbacteria bacterium RIFOXYC12_FULL_46_25]|uniref:Uncharacterized protein n=1 Tax=Candidatus Lloydbacteria bacterium RIFOXYC12_FULL_46_25 TaxID=1798670 RepID=A0A1G2DU19_9BACT|nr:MAG: hypothetical protein A2494_03670 [Candidatus Lloydbacteria bacterium RIFOXYC12_FULL_46_25]